MNARGIFGFSVCFALTVAWLAAMFISSDPAHSAATTSAMQGPSAAHWFGTDQLGRDIGMRLIDSVQAFFLPGLFACAVAVGIGVPAGAVASFWPERAMSRIIKAVLHILDAWPRLVLVIVVISIFTVSLRDPARWGGVRLYMLGAVLGLSFLPQMATAVGSKVSLFHQEEFVEAARAHGVPDGRILAYHILWANCRHLVLRQACLLFGAFILVETSLSYLGDYGVPPPRPSWGNILAGVRSNVVHTRTLIQPEHWTPPEVWAGLGRAINEGGAIALLAPTGAIVLAIGGVLSLAAHFAAEDRR